MRRTLCSEEVAGYIQSFTPHNHDLLTIKQLLGHCAGQTAEEVTLAIDNNLTKIGLSASFSAEMSKI